LKLAVLGGGGVRSVFLAKSLLNRAEKLSIDDIVFMDNDKEKLRIYGGLAREVVRRANNKIRFSLTSDGSEAVRDADFVITMLRVGQDEARVLDERIALKYGVLGQETTGAGGFAMAARTIPVLKEYMEQIRLLSKPDAVVFNFTNPSGMITQALRDEGYNNVYGICDAPSEFTKQLARLLKVPLNELSVECFGLNHLSWFRSVKHNGNEMLRELIANPRLYTETDERVFEPKLVKSMDMLLNEYLYFYYYKEKAVQNILHSNKTRGETIKEINDQMFKELSQLDPEKDFEKALRIYLHSHDRRNKSYMSIELDGERDESRNIVTEFSLSEEDDGGYAGVALNLIEALVNGKPCEMVLSVPNMGAVEGLKDDDVVEITCRLSKDGAKPVQIGAVPAMQLQLIRQIKLYEKLSIQAINEKDVDLAVKALMVNPLVNSYPTAQSIINDYMEAHRKYTYGWR